VAAFTVPTDAPESDGTLEWDSTTIVVVHASAGGITGLGYTYAHAAAADVVARTLVPVVAGRDAMDVRGSTTALARVVRNAGRPGIASTAVAALDAALWDLKARLLHLPLVSLIGGAREAIPLYGSGGFTSYTDARLAAQLGGWAAQGLRAVKMKIGRDEGDDRRRVRVARSAVGPDVGLFVDANGAYDRKQAIRQAEAFAAEGVSWFEEPVTSEDLEGLRLVRDRVPAGIEVAAGEYGYGSHDFHRLLAAGAVDVLQADATRCGVTGFLDAAALCDAWSVPLSAHTAPALHAHLCCAVPRARHLEYFHDHVRIERLLFDGVTEPSAGVLRPDLSRPGLGLELKRRDAERFAVGG
jgi:L-alanine-DL-glutamate epimerase-like enolase superfamily enzyme